MRVRIPRLLPSVLLMLAVASQAFAGLSAGAAWSHAGSGRHGASVTTAGDFNCDGISDLAVGTPDATVGLPGDGLIEIWYGHPDRATEGTGAPNWTALGDFGQQRELGASLAAGDLNGDQCDDLIAGSPATINGAGVDRADVKVYFGAYAFPVSSFPGWRATGFSNATTFRGHFGASVASADVNGDEYADVIVGEPRARIGAAASDASEGAVLVWLGSPGFDAEPDGTSANADWIAQSDQANAHLGASVAGTGDVDSDGDDEILAGAPDFDDSGYSDEGRAWMWSGNPSLESSPDGTPANASWSAELLFAGAHLGASVAAAGDLDRDGYADFLVGAPDFDNATISGGQEGLVMVVRGGASGPPAGAYSWSYAGTTSTGRLGASVATAGDVNGDGVADYVVGEPGTASAYLQLGTPGPTPLPFPSLTYSEPFASFGAVVGTPSDWNGDGFSDVVVAAPDAPGGGRVFVHLGSGETLAADPVFAARQGVAGAGLGLGLGFAGDINHDGFSDFVVGAPHYESGASEDGEGRFTVVYGGSCGPACAPITDAPAAGQREGNELGAQLGTSVTGAGDVDNDGYTDVIVGAPGFDAQVPCGLFFCPYPDSGQARVYRGGPGGLAYTPAVTLGGIPEIGAKFGTSVASAGDVNGDGHGDVIVGAPFASNGLASEGRVYLYLGSPQGLIPSPARILHGGNPNARFGVSVASAGDVNGDGFGDVIIGADGFGGAGAAFLFLGSAEPSGLAASPARSWFGANGSSFGLAVAGAGDVNRDGFSDVAVGAPTAPWSFGLYRGEVTVYHGGPALPSTTPNATLHGDDPSFTDTRFGSGVATAGDVNGDGFADLIVGDQWFYGPAGFAQGKAYVFHGGGGGLSTTAARTFMDCATAECDFGRDVSGAGDVNGDGFSDVLIGGFKDSDGALYEGAVFVHLGNDGRGTPLQLALFQLGPFGPASLLGLNNAPAANFAFQSPAGRNKLRAEWQWSPFGSGFFSNINVSVTWDNGFPSGMLGHSGSIYDTIYMSRFRIRNASPLFGRGRWLSPPGNGPLEADVRTIPEPELVAGLGAGLCALALLARRRRAAQRIRS